MKFPSLAFIVGASLAPSPLLVQGSAPLNHINEANLSFPRTVSTSGLRAEARERLMNAAVRVDPVTLRRLENNNNNNRNNNNGFQISSDYSIRFQQCTSLVTESPNDNILFSDELIEYTRKRAVVAAQSYVLFNVCETAYCAYYGSDESVYMVDLATYLDIFLDYLPEQRQRYCETCQEAQNWCEYGQFQQGGGNQQEGQQQGQQQQEEKKENEDNNHDENNEEGREGENNREGEENNHNGEGGGGGRRQLNNNNNNNNKNNRRAQIKSVECSVCQSRGCFDENQQQQNNNGQVQINDENIYQWAQGILQCQQTDAFMGSFPLYAGFMCNQAGDGVEIGVFLDQYCSIYTSTKQYRNIASSSNQALYYNSKEIVTYPFLNSFDCGENIQYVTPEAYEQMVANGEVGNQDQNDDEAGEASEYCRELVKKNSYDLYDCNGDGQRDQQNNQIEEQQDNDNSWYAFTLSQNDAANNQAVCKILQTMAGEYTVVYNSDEKQGSGSFYVYNTKKSSGILNRPHGGVLLFFVVVGVLVTVFAVSYIVKTVSSGSSKKESLITNQFI